MSSDCQKFMNSSAAWTSIEVPKNNGYKTAAMCDGSGCMFLLESTTMATFSANPRLAPFADRTRSTYDAFFFSLFVNGKGSTTGIDGAALFPPSGKAFRGGGNAG